MSSPSTSASASKPQPFKIAVPDATLQRIAAQLERARLPPEPIVTGGGGGADPASASQNAPAEWEHGTSLRKLGQLVAAWRDGTAADADGAVSGGAGRGFVSWWRSIEERLNACPHYVADVRGMRLHYVHVRSEHPGAIPLIMPHGWPGSFYEAYHIIPLLTAKDEKTGVSFDVIVPSLPGFAWSVPSRGGAGGAGGAQDDGQGLGRGMPAGWDGACSAACLHALMVDVLGYASYAVSGGDWGSLMARYLANYPECRIYHTNFAPPTNMPWSSAPVIALYRAGYINAFKRILASTGYSSFDLLGVLRGLTYEKTGSGYVAEQSTKPATLGYALYDNPVGILSWMLEKFEAWCDPRCAPFRSSSNEDAARSGSGSEVTTRMSDETILVNATIYAVTDSIHTSFMLYYTDTERWRPQGFHYFKDGRNKPYGHSAFPYELARGPANLLGRLGLNLKWYKQEDEGGHFAAWEVPHLLAEHLRDFAAQHWTA